MSALVPITITFEVATPSKPSSAWKLVGDLYLPASGETDTVQLLLSGLTYDRRYWTVPGLDYVHHATGAGHAVLALDRIGVGDSDHPPAHLVTVDANVETVHQVVQALCAGHAGIQSFRHVVAVGHSLGSGIALIDSARYHDFDALVLTGLLHAFGPLYPQAVAGLHPAQGHPRGYLTTRPGVRAPNYEFADGVDPDISEYHERTKSTVTTGEGSTVDEIYRADYAGAVDVPILLVIGRHDGLFGGGDVVCEQAEVVAKHERDFYTGTFELEAFVVPDAAHSINLHRTAPQWYEHAQKWLARIAPSVAHATSTKTETTDVQQQ
jgi:pimeloyl-ACP methyl ester carboxylesterase